MANQKNRKPHRSGARSSTHDAHTAADGFGKGKTKCFSCRGKKGRWEKMYFSKEKVWIECTVCSGRGWV